jgi:hypothetical protein
VAKLASTSLTAEVLENRCRPTKIYWRHLAETAKARKTLATDPDEKNRLWFVGAYAQGTELYLESYRLMGRGQFMDGWCTLEQAELAFERLEDNAFVPPLAPCVARRAELVALWQSTFPYRHFISPAMIFKRWECSICGKQSTPVDPCGHIPNRVYAGELCYRRILEAIPREVSIVTDPVQKYSVLQLDYDYSVTQYVLDHLTGPFHRWSGEWTHKRHPHDRFASSALDGPCPCDSKLRYSECCLPTEGVRLPHFQMMVASRSHEGILEERLVQRVAAKPAEGEEAGTFRATVLRGA